MKTSKPVCYNPFSSLFPSENFSGSPILGGGKEKYSVLADNQGYKPKGDTVFSILSDHELPGKISFLAVHGQKFPEKLLFWRGHYLDFPKKLTTLRKVGFVLLNKMDGIKSCKIEILKKLINSLKN